MALVKEFEAVILNEIAKAGYETMFEERWDELHPRSIERAMWEGIAQNMLMKYWEFHSGSAKVST